MPWRTDFCTHLTPLNQNQGFFSLHIHTYNQTVLHAFTPLPAQGKATELAKRLSLIALPVMYALLGLGWLTEKTYYKITHFWACRSVKIAAQQLINSMTFPNRGQGPFEFVGLLSIRSQGATLYGDLMAMRSDQNEAGTLPSFAEELQGRISIIQENMCKLRFSMIQKVEIEWIGFLKNREGRILKTQAHCTGSFLLSGGGFGAVGAWRTQEQARENYRTRLQELNLLHPQDFPHFAAP